MQTVLVVDDDKTFTGLLKTVLELEGYEATAVTRPQDVLPTARELGPVLVLMDVHAGHEDTIGVLRDLRSDEATGTIPVVMTSGMDHAAECLEAGADAFILKPFRPSEFLEKLREFTGGQDTQP